MSIFFEPWILLTFEICSGCCIPNKTSFLATHKTCIHENAFSRSFFPHSPFQEDCPLLYLLLLKMCKKVFQGIWFPAFLCHNSPPPSPTSIRKAPWRWREFHIYYISEYLTVFGTLVNNNSLWINIWMRESFL